MPTIAAYIGAAFAEIVGCFSFWAWLRMGKSPLWLAPGLISLAIFAYLLALVDSAAAGRAYAAYGGVYIVASIFWLLGDRRRAAGQMGSYRNHGLSSGRCDHSSRTASRVRS